jgi:hypothetical protein
MCRLSVILVSLAAALPGAPALAQTLYKSTMPDGRVVYGDKPAPGAVKVEEQVPKSKQQKGVVPPTAGERELLKKMEAERQQREAAQDRLRRAEIALHDAEVALAMGREPQPNERIGTAGGKSRLSDAYWERVKKLEENVEQARRNLEKVRAGQ